MLSWSRSKREASMALVMAVIIGGVGVACVAWPVRAVTFCRWYHKKPKWIQELPFADIVMRPWMPIYFRCME